MKRREIYEKITKYLLIVCAFIFNFSILAYAEDVTGGELNTLHNNNLSLRKTIERTFLEDSRNYRAESYLVPNSTPIGQAVVAVEAFTLDEGYIVEPVYVDLYEGETSTETAYWQVRIIGTINGTFFKYDNYKNLYNKKYIRYPEYTETISEITCLEPI